MTEDNGAVAIQPETKLDSAGSMMVKIFMEPSKVFHRVKQKPLWVIPFIILLLIVTAMSVLTAPLQLQAQKEMIMQSDRYTPEQKEQIAAQMDQMGGLAYISAIAAPVMVAIFFFLGVGVLMLMANVILGGDAGFSQVASITAWAGMITALGMIVKTGLVMLKGSIDVRTSLALLLPGGDMRSWAYVLLNTFTDVFAIWGLIVTIIGIGIIYGFSKGRATIAAVVPTVIFLGVAAVAAKMFG